MAIDGGSVVNDAYSGYDIGFHIAVVVNDKSSAVRSCGRTKLNQDHMVD